VDNRRDKAGAGERGFAGPARTFDLEPAPVTRRRVPELRDRLGDLGLAAEKIQNPIFIERLEAGKWAEGSR
jgi:hypothetical protein